MLTRRRAPVLCLLVLTTLLLLIYGEQPARAQTSAPAESPPTSPAQQSPRTASAPGNSQTSTTAPNSQTTATAPVASAEPDLSITARVTARELTFEVVPTPRVEFTGRQPRATVWQAERENLPAAVRPGETYRDIGIRLRITSVFADIDRIVAEALGEVPTDEQGETNQMQTNQASPPSAAREARPSNSRSASSSSSSAPSSSLSSSSAPSSSTSSSPAPSSARPSSRRSRGREARP